jgi:vacuolar iron transporter family protein
MSREHLGSSAFITDIVIGMSDGLTIPFALAAGLSGAVQSNAVVITAGIAEIVAGSIAMGLGGYPDRYNGCCSRLSYGKII